MLSIGGVTWYKQKRRWEIRMAKSLIAREIRVSLDFGQSNVPVVSLALRDHRITFEHDAQFIEHGLEISPSR